MQSACPTSIIGLIATPGKDMATPSARSRGNGDGRLNPRCQLGQPSCRRAETGCLGSYTIRMQETHHLPTILPPAIPETDGGMEILSQEHERNQAQEPTAEKYAEMSGVKTTFTGRKC
jgi:hypothetical protein